MEENDLLQSNSDDEVMVKQADGTFKKVRLSELSAPPAARKQAPPAMKPATPPVPVSLPIAKHSSPPVPASTAPAAQSVAPATTDFENQAESLVDRLAADIASNLKPRVKMLLVSYLKGIRQEYAVRERLLQSVESGGLGWDMPRTDLFLKQMKALSGQVNKEFVPPPRAKTTVTQQINEALPSPQMLANVMSKKIEAAVEKQAPEEMNRVESNLLPEIEPEMHVSKMSTAPPQPRNAPQSKLVNAPRVVPPKPPQPPLAGATPPPQEQSLSKPPQKPQQEKKPITKSVALKSEPVKSEPLKAPLASTPSSASFVPPAPRTSDGIRASAPQVLKIIEEKGEKPRVVPHEDAIPPQKQPPHIAIPQTPSGKADVKDIAYKPHLVGPIEELHTLTLVDFRRLSRDPQVAADKIHAKIELLGEESFEKKIKGILAWRASEINQIYNTLLNESIKTAVPIKEILSARVARKEQAFTETEFRAIMNLNKQLRF